MKEKMLTNSANRPTSFPLKKGNSVSLHPKPELEETQLKKRKKASASSLAIAIILLSLAYQYGVVSEHENQEHPHRHHHRSVSSPDQLLGLNKCNNGSYPRNWENIMMSLGKEEKNFDNELSSTPGTNLTVDSKDDNYGDNTSSPVDNVVIHNWQPHVNLLQGQNREARQFSLLDNSFHCPAGTYEQMLHWHSSAEESWSKHKPQNTKIELSTVSVSVEDGHLTWHKANGESLKYNTSEYCVWKYGNEWASFKVCSPTCAKQNQQSKIPKCCPRSEIISIDGKNKGCKQSNPVWRPTFYKTSGNSVTKMDEREAPNSSSIFNYGFPYCENKYIINESPTNNFNLLANGTLLLQEKDSTTYIEPGDFCIDGFQFHYTRESEKIYRNSEWDQIVIACEPNTYLQKIQKIRIQIFAALNSISVTFLLLTDVVYILIWRHQTNIHSWLQFSYATSLLFTFTCFLIVQIWSSELLKIASLCKIMGWVNHSTYLSAFFWLTSMNFDLWWRFSRPLRSTRVQTQEKKRRRFLGFAIFSIGVPLLISSIGIVVDYKYGDMDREALLYLALPGFGTEKCYFRSKHSQIPYLYFPAGILLLVNFIFFASTVLHLRKMHTHTELARTQSTSTLEDRRGLRVIAKLFVVMGILWVFELIIWICHLIFTKPDHELILIFVFTPLECLNCMHGVFIFLIFICKPNVRSQLGALLQRDETAKAWNKQTQLPSISTVQQPINTTHNECVQVK